MTKCKYIAPDGGWGWVIVVAFALNNVVMIPIMQGFTLVYREAFERLNISATESTIIININQAFGMILGLMNGPMLRSYGYRKMAIVGSLLYSAGVILTSFASSFIHFVIAYGMMTSLGMSIGMSAFSLALNTYFKEKRGRAMGLSMTLTGLGPIFIPHLTSLLLSIYNSERTMFILGALSLNSLAGAILLQPIKWHAKPVKITEENVEKGEVNSDDLKNESANTYITQESVSLLAGSKDKSIDDMENETKKCARKRVRTVTISSTDFIDDNVSIYGFETPISMQNGSLLDLRGDWAAEEEDLNRKNEEENKFHRHLSTGNLKIDFKRSNSFNEAKARKFSLGSKYGDLALSRVILAECPEEDGEHTKANDHDKMENRTYKPQPTPAPVPEAPSLPATEETTSTTKKPKSLLMRLLKRIALFFDLALLRDPVYVNIMLGMSIAIFAEFNFSVLTPLILKDMHLDTNGTAMVMSTLATADLMLRALAPYIGEWLRKPPRVMYLVSLFLLILTRSALIFANNYSTMLIVGISLGIAKGIRSVFMTLVIPDHVPLERLAAASSIQSLANGFILLAAGPLLGVIRDMTGSYVFCIILINFVTAITIVMWLGEVAIKRIRKRRKPESSKELEQDIKKVESR